MILLGYLVGTVLFPLLTILLAFWSRLRFEEVGLFIGPRLWGWQHGRVYWRINPVPLGSYVKFSEEDFAKASLVTKLMIQLAPHILTVLMGVGSAALIGATGMWDPRPLYLGMLQGALHPFSVGPSLLRDLADFSAAHPATAFCSTIAAVGWLNLLPFPINGMGLAIIEVITACRPMPETLRSVIMWLGLLAVVVLLVTWCVAGGVWLFGG